MTLFVVLTITCMLTVSTAGPLGDCSATCRQVCEFGYLDDGTCPRCACAPDPCENIKCEFPTLCVSLQNTECGYVGCPSTGECMGTGLVIDPYVIMPKLCPIRCEKLCEFGYLDDGICPRCTCAPDPCQNKKCEGSAVCVVMKTASCSYDGCPDVGECKGTGLIVNPVPADPSQPCEATTKKSCQFGFRLQNCPRDRCAANPCERKKCARGKRCVAVSQKCAFNHGCPKKARCVRKQGKI